MLRVAILQADRERSLCPAEGESREQDLSASTTRQCLTSSCVASVAPHNSTSAHPAHIERQNKYGELLKPHCGSVSEMKCETKADNFTRVHHRTLLWYRQSEKGHVKGTCIVQRANMEPLKTG